MKSYRSVSRINILFSCYILGVENKIANNESKLLIKGNKNYACLEVHLYVTSQLFLFKLFALASGYVQRCKGV